MRYESTSFNRIVDEKPHRIELGLLDAICLSDSFVFMLGHFVNFKAMTYDSTSFNRIVDDKSHRIKLALRDAICLTDSLLFVSVISHGQSGHVAIRSRTIMLGKQCQSVLPGLNTSEN